MTTDAPSDNWTITAKRLPLFGNIPIIKNIPFLDRIAESISGHLYIQIHDENGELVTQLDGISTNRDTGEWHTMGLRSAQIRAYNHPISPVWDESKHRKPHDSVELFSGSREDALTALHHMDGAARWINEQDHEYSLFGRPSFNSNSVFNAMVEAMSEVITINDKAAITAKRMGGFTPGSNRDMLPDNAWMALVDPDATVEHMKENLLARRQRIGEESPTVQEPDSPPAQPTSHAKHDAPEASDVGFVPSPTPQRTTAVPQR